MTIWLTALFTNSVQALIDKLLKLFLSLPLNPSAVSWRLYWHTPSLPSSKVSSTVKRRFLYHQGCLWFQKQCSTPTEIIYFSDGAASQYKNRKNFLNLYHHQADFGTEAEWHFSATSHEKSAVNGLGGTVKHLAVRASLHRPYKHQIMTPLQLYQWAMDNVPGVHFCYCSTEEILWGRRISYKLSLNKQEQFLICANYILSFRFPRTH